MAPAVPCKTSKKSKHGRPVVRPMISNHNLTISEASESTRLCMEESLPNYHEDHIAGRRRQFAAASQFGTQFFLCSKQWRCPQQKQQWTKNGRNLKRIRRGTWQKSETHQRSSMKQGRRAQKFILLLWWTSVLWRIPKRRQSTQNAKVELYSFAIWWNMILDLMQFALNKAAAKVMDNISRLPGSAGQAADAVSADTQVKMEDAPK